MAFRGEIATLPIGLDGFNGSKNASKLSPGNFAATEGVDLDGEVLVKDGGAIKLNAVALGSPSKVAAGLSWSPTPSTPNDVVFLGNGQLRKDTGAGTFATLLATLSAPSLFPPYLMPCGGEAVGSPRRLFIFSESNQVQVINGTGNTAAAISGPPADWAASFPIFGVQHSNRVFGGGNANDPHRLYYSTTANHQDFVGAGSGTLAIFPGEGDQIVGGISFRGLLVLFKYPQGVYLVDTRDPTVANWRVDRLNKAVGAASPWCIIQISNDILILDPYGNFHLMSSVNDFSDVSTSDISRRQNIGPFMRANVGLLNMRKAMGAWYAIKSKAWFMVPLVGSPDNNLRMMVDFNDAQKGARFYLSRRDIGDALWMRPDSSGVQRPTLGDNAGFVWLMDQEAQDKAGLAYDMIFETAEDDFSHVDPQLGPRTKNGQFVEITSDLVANVSITMTPIWDGFIGTPFIFNLGQIGNVLDSFILDTDILSASGTVTSQHRLEGQGRRLKLIVQNSAVDEEVRISEVRVGITPADERLRTV